MCTVGQNKGDIWLTWIYSSTIIAFITSIFAFIVLGILYKSLIKNNLNWVDEHKPSKAVIYSSICYPTFQGISWTVWWILQLMSITTCATNVLPTQEKYYLIEHYPGYSRAYVIIATIGMLCAVFSIFVLFPAHMIFR